MRVLKSYFISYFADRLVGFQQPVFYLVDNGQVDMFDSGFACLLLYEIAEIIGGEVELVGAPRNERKSQLLWFRRFKVV